MIVRYFSWLKNRLGKAGEDFTLPDGVSTPQGLIEWMAGQDKKYQVLLAARGAIKIAINGELTEDWECASLKNTDKIDFFAPMAGG